ncbi:MAG: Retron-type reverse transcriptase [Parcubacteria group bacterium Athens1014_10]|nr:MAG: Retron-type reverse transcriptase [Parcubacteria group bacterium Athens1014_10]TSD05470.1 MAG: Retron-type reverse transcriptase [Parcubacteria group bacterium Athens0714_12]
MGTKIYPSFLLLPQKQILQHINKGINFIGYIIKPHYTLVRRRIVKNLKRKLWQFNLSLRYCIFPCHCERSEAIPRQDATNQRDCHSRSPAGDLLHNDTSKLSLRGATGRSDEAIPFANPRDCFVASAEAPRNDSDEQLKQILSVINSYYGQFKHSNTFNLRKHLYQKHFGILKNYLEPADPVRYDYFKIKNFKKIKI